MKTFVYEPFFFFYLNAFSPCTNHTFKETQIKKRLKKKTYFIIS